MKQELKERIEAEVSYKFAGKIVTLLAVVGLFLMGVVEGYKGMIIFPEELIILLGLIMIIGLSIFFYYKGREDKRNNKLDGFVMAAVIGTLYLLTTGNLLVVAVSGIVAYLIAIYRR